MGKRKLGLCGFKSFGERGAWVELLFMAAALSYGYRALKPWGDVLPYDVGIEVDGRLLRVQVKSTTNRIGGGYKLEFIHGCKGNSRRYDAGELDICVGYVIPQKVWYIIPAHHVTGRKGKAQITVCQFESSLNRPHFEHYREAWDLLGKDRGELARM